MSKQKIHASKSQVFHSISDLQHLYIWLGLRDEFLRGILKDSRLENFLNLNESYFICQNVVLYSKFRILGDMRLSCRISGGKLTGGE